MRSTSSTPPGGSPTRSSRPAPTTAWRWSTSRSRSTRPSSSRATSATSVRTASTSISLASSAPARAGDRLDQINPNFFPIQLTTVGPNQRPPTTFFGQRVLGVAEPTLADFRPITSLQPRQRDQERHRRWPDDPGGAAPGTVGIIGFSFYELFEDKLRPLEIDGQSGDRCVFPPRRRSRASLYLLERTLRLYTTQRSLNRQEVQAYLKYYPTFEEISDDLELIPISDAVRRQELARISDPLAYGETPNGETSEPDLEGVVATTTTPEVERLLAAASTPRLRQAAPRLPPPPPPRRPRRPPRRPRPPLT